MYQEEAPQQAIALTPINHAYYAFLAAANGNTLFLEVLLGPSIPAEKLRVEELSAEIQSLDSREAIWQFKLRLLEAKLKILKNHSKDETIEQLNKKLDACVRPLIETSCDAFIDGLARTTHLYFTPDELVIPVTDFADESNRDSAPKLKDFIAERVDIQPNAEGNYSIEYTDAIKKALHQLWMIRYDAMAQRTSVQVSHEKNIKTKINDLELHIKIADGIVEKFSDRKRKLANKQADLNSVQYRKRIQRFEQAIATFESCPGLIPEVYQAHKGNLLALFRSVKVPQDALNDQGDTLLHVATRAKKFDVVQLLIERKIDLRSKNREGCMAAELINANEDDLRNLAKVYKKRTRSKYLATVIKHVETYEKAHFQIERSIKKYLHTEKRLQERGKQLVRLKKAIEEAKKIPTDELLGAIILYENIIATRGSRNRSELFDPLVEATIRFQEEPGYGITNQDVMGLLDGQESKLIIAELTRANIEKALIIETLKNQLITAQNERDSTLRENIELKKVIESLSIRERNESRPVEKKQMADQEIQEKVDDNNKRVEEHQRAHAAELANLAKQVEALTNALHQQQMSLSAQSSPPSPVITQNQSTLAETHGTLFAAPATDGSGRFGAIPLKELEQQNSRTKSPH